MSQILNTKNSFSDLKSIASSETSSNTSFKVKFDEEVDHFLKVLAIEVNQNWKQKKKKLKTSQIDTFKQIKFSNEIFDYIYIAKYQKLFLLA